LSVDVFAVEKFALGSAVAVIGLSGVFWFLRLFRFFRRQLELVVRVLGAGIPIPVATVERFEWWQSVVVAVRVRWLERRQPVVERR
jgi:hypothetical protein